jgi:hypothetical protein
MTRKQRRLLRRLRIAAALLMCAGVCAPVLLAIAR